MRLRAFFFACLAVLSLSVLTLRAEDVTLKITIWASDEGLSLEQKIFTRFEETHPGIKIKVVYIPWANYNDKLLTMVVANTPPDLMWIQIDKFPYFASRDVLVDLDPLIDQDPEGADMRKTIFSGGLQFCAWKGKQYALPRDCCCWFIAYNKDLFDKEGLPYPQETWTRDDYVRIAQRLTKKDQNGLYTQFGSWWYDWAEVMASNGGNLFDPNTHEAKITSPEVIEAMQWCADLSKKYHVAPRDRESNAFGGDLFQSQRVAMNFAGPWMFSTYQKNCKFKWDIVNLPAGKAGLHQYFMGLPIGISRQTEHPKEAWEFLRYLCWDKEAQSMQAQIGLATPSRKDLAYGDVFVKQPAAPPHIGLYIKAMDQYAGARMYTTNWNELMSTLQPKIDLLFLEENNQTAEQLMNEILPKFSRKLKKSFLY